MFGVTEAVLLSGLKMQRQAYELRWRLERERALAAAGLQLAERFNPAGLYQRTVAVRCSTRRVVMRRSTCG